MIKWKMLVSPIVSLALLGTDSAEGGKVQKEDEYVLVGAGDIADCDLQGDEQTAALLDGIPGTVFTLGDNAYLEGSADQYAECYDPGWGRFKDRTRPVPGNHEYRTEGATPYFDYFGAAAGTRGEGWYSYHLGDWLVLALNSNCPQVGCDDASAQMAWLRQQLDSDRSECALAMWHHPPFTSGDRHKPAPELRPMFEQLYLDGVEVLLTGHNHQYERFAPQAADGRLDDYLGVREFVVGTGGAPQYGWGTIAENSEVRAQTKGVLKLTLRPHFYDWEFISVGGDFTDSGTGACHGLLDSKSSELSRK